MRPLLIDAIAQAGMAAVVALALVRWQAWWEPALAMGAVVAMVEVACRACGEEGDDGR